MKLGFLEKAERADVSATPAEYDVDGGTPLGRYQLLVTADRAIHVTRNGTASADTGLRIPANTLVALSAWGDDVLSYVLANGEADSGSIWICRTDS
jgi:hypothetical protein